MTNDGLARIARGTSLILLFLLLSSCGGGGDDEDVEGTSIPATGYSYIVLAWNDLGMHCLNPTYDKAVILPPYNTIWAQVILRGNPPRIVSSGITVEYSIANNTYSYGKQDYGQFWDYALKLFGVNLPIDTGLNLEDPGIHNGLAGQMVLKGNHFQADGIPVTPVYDDGKTWNPYQVAVITVKDTGGAVLAATRATVPTSEEISCGKCHGSDPLLDVLQVHDKNEGTRLEPQRPVLCAQCHGSPALGTTGPGSSGKYLSEAIHLFHSGRDTACYDCHPGPTTRCNRSIRHASPDGNCVTCHGGIGEVGSSIASGARTPWVNEPGCDAANCHSGSIPEVDTGATLYRKSAGHGGVNCAGCHGSPHAMVPSNQPSDNYQAIQYQGAVKSLGSCGVCHDESRGEGLEEFQEAHGGGRATACSVCHTVAPSLDTTKWPHGYQWKNR